MGNSTTTILTGKYFFLTIFLQIFYWGWYIFIQLEMVHLITTTPCRKSVAKSFEKNTSPLVFEVVYWPFFIYVHFWNTGSHSLGWPSTRMFALINSTITSPKNKKKYGIPDRHYLCSHNPDHNLYLKLLNLYHIFSSKKKIIT